MEHPRRDARQPLTEAPTRPPVEERVGARRPVQDGPGAVGKVEV